MKALKLFFLICTLMFVLCPQLMQAQSIEALYDTPPNVEQCDPGVLKESEKLAVLEYLNEVRALHDLAPVTYDYQHDEETAQAALLIVANNSMSHRPSNWAECFTEAGYAGSSTSNLRWVGPEEFKGEPLFGQSVGDIRSWMVDENVYSLGHRRWLLDPFLTQISYGRVDGAPWGYDKNQIAQGSAIKVFGYDEGQTPTHTPDFVAYPYRDYPVDLFLVDWYWSFSAVIDPLSQQNNDDVDYQDAAITITGQAGEKTVQDVSSNTDGFGLPNFLQWKVADVQINQPYHVQIDNVLVQGQARNYEYYVLITPSSYEQINTSLIEDPQADEIIPIKSGDKFAVAVKPPYRIDNGYSYSDRRMDIQSTEYSPYATIYRVAGAVGSELYLTILGVGQVTIRVTESATGSQTDTPKPDIQVPEKLNNPEPTSTRLAMPSAPIQTSMLVADPPTCTEPIELKNVGAGQLLTTYAQQSMQIATIDQADQRLNLLTTEPGFHNFPVWSPNGAQIAFIFEDRLYTIDANGNNRKQVSELEAFVSAPAWSPDGQWIAFSVTPQTEGFQMIKKAAEIYLVQPDGNNLRRLTTDERHDYSPVWSPTGERVAYMSDPFAPGSANPNNIPTEVFILNLAGGTNIQIGAPKHHALEPIWSPDGERLAYVKVPTQVNMGDFFNPSIDNAHIFLVNADGSNQIQITPNHLRAVSPSWSPDGKWLAFAARPSSNADTEETSAIYAVKTDRSCWRQLMPGITGQIYDVTWSPYDSQIALQSNRSMFEFGPLTYTLTLLDAATQQNNPLIVFEETEVTLQTPFGKPIWRPLCAVQAANCDLPTIPILQTLIDHEFVIIGTQTDQDSTIVEQPTNLDATRVFSRSLAFADEPLLHPSNTYVTVLSVADFNGDNFGDVAVTDLQGTIMILLGAGDGRLQEIATYPVTANYRKLRIGDINGDKKQDIVGFTDESNAPFTVLFGLGDGTFEPVAQELEAELALPIGIGDMNGDGQDDLIFYETSLEILLAGGVGVVYSWDGAGSFQPLSQTLLETSFIRQDGTTDLDKDGNLDLLLHSGDKLLILYGNGQGEFPESYELQPDHGGLLPLLQSGMLQAMDLNGDQVLDIVVGIADSEYSNTPMIQLFLSNEKRAYTEAPLIPLTGQLAAIHLFDANQDGFTDILAAEGNQIRLELLLNRGNGTFAEAIVKEIGNLSASLMTIADMNHADQPDVVFFNSGQDDNLGVWLASLTPNNQILTQSNTVTSTDSAIATPTAAPANTIDTNEPPTPSIMFCPEELFDREALACKETQDRFTGVIKIIHVSWHDLPEYQDAQFKRVWYFNGVRFLEREGTDAYAHLEVSSRESLSPGNYRFELYVGEQLVQAGEFEIQ